MTPDSSVPSHDGEPLYYYADASNVPTGPLSRQKLQHLRSVGVISDETLVIEDGGSEWRKYAAIVAGGGPASLPPVPDAPPPTQQPKAKKKGCGCVSVLLMGGLFVLFCVALSNSHQRPKQSGTSPVAPSPVAPRSAQTAYVATTKAGSAAERVAKAQVEKIAKECFGSELTETEVVEIYGKDGNKSGTFNVKLRYNVGVGWSAKSQKSSIETKMRDAYEKLFTTVPGVWEAWIFADANLIDGFGQESVGLVYKTSMSKEVAAKINWKNKWVLDFTKLWSEHFIHPALSKE